MTHYIPGDATPPLGEGHKLICHGCNDIGAWGAGFVLALSARWPEPEAAYRSWPDCDRHLGAIQVVPVGNDISVVNMIAQLGVTWSAAGAPLRYSALATCLRKVAGYASATGETIHMPRISCRWQTVEAIIDKELAGVEVYVYDLPKAEELRAA